MNYIEKRTSVKDDYNLIADRYCSEYGKELIDIDLIDRFISLLNKESLILDLAGVLANIQIILVRSFLFE